MNYFWRVVLIRPLSLWFLVSFSLVFFHFFIPFSEIVLAFCLNICSIIWSLTFLFMIFGESIHALIETFCVVAVGWLLLIERVQGQTILCTHFFGSNSSFSKVYGSLLLPSVGINNTPSTIVNNWYTRWIFHLWKSNIDSGQKKFQVMFLSCVSSTVPCGTAEKIKAKK